MDWKFFGLWCCGMALWLLEAVVIALVVFGTITMYGAVALYIIWIALFLTALEWAIHHFDSEERYDDSAFELGVSQSMQNEKLSRGDVLIGLLIILLSPLYVLVWPVFNWAILHYRTPKSQHKASTA